MRVNSPKSGAHLEGRLRIRPVLDLRTEFLGGSTMFEFFKRKQKPTVNPISEVQEHLRIMGTT
jgi:hypothetical protein